MRQSSSKEAVFALSLTLSNEETFIYVLQALLWCAGLVAQLGQSESLLSFRSRVRTRNLHEVRGTFAVKQNVPLEYLYSIFREKL